MIGLSEVSAAPIPISVHPFKNGMHLDFSMQMEKLPDLETAFQTFGIVFQEPRSINLNALRNRLPPGYRLISFSTENQPLSLRFSAPFAVKAEAFMRKKGVRITIQKDITRPVVKQDEKEGEKSEKNQEETSPKSLDSPTTQKGSFSVEKEEGATSSTLNQPTSEKGRGKEVENLQTHTLNKQEYKDVPQDKVDISFVIDSVPKIQFHWEKSVKSAIFIRGEYLWVIFDTPARFNLEALKEAQSKGSIGRYDAFFNDMSSGVRIALKTKIFPKVSRQDFKWGVALCSEISANQKWPLEIKILENHIGQKSIFFKVGNPGKNIEIRDPDHLDSMYAIPFSEPDMSFNHRHEYVDISFIPARQGIVYTPHVEDLEVTIDLDSVKITKPSGLNFSPLINKEVEESVDFINMPPIHLPMSKMSLDGWVEKRNTLRQKAYQKKGKDRKEALLTYMQFLIDSEMFREASTILDIIKTNFPEYTLEEEFLHKQMFLLLQQQEYNQAKDVIIQNNLSINPQIKILEAYIDAMQGRWTNAYSLFKYLYPYISDYSRPMALQLLFSAIEASLEVADTPFAEWLLKAVPENLEDYDYNQNAYLNAFLQYRKGNPERSTFLLRQLIKSYDTFIKLRLKSVLLLSSIEKNTKNFDADYLIKHLEELLNMWSGDYLELSLIQDLVELYKKQKSYQKAIQTLDNFLNRYQGDFKGWNVAQEKQDLLEYALKSSDVSNIDKILLLSQFADYLRPSEGIERALISTLNRMFVGALYEQVENILQSIRNNPNPSLRPEQMHYYEAILKWVSGEYEKAQEIAEKLDKEIEEPGILRQKIDLLLSHVYTHQHDYMRALSYAQRGDSIDFLDRQASLLKQMRNWQDLAEVYLKMVPLHRSNRSDIFSLEVETQKEDSTKEEKSYVNLEALLHAMLTYRHLQNYPKVQELYKQYEAAIKKSQFTNAFDMIARHTTRSVEGVEDFDKALEEVKNMDGFVKALRTFFGKK